MNKLSDYLFFRVNHVCPRWLCFTFDNILRRLVQNPYEVLNPYIKEGDIVLDVGPGIGYFTIPAAEMVGDKGLVIAADVQPQMLHAISKRAQRRGLLQRIELKLSSANSLGVEAKVDFILAFWMVHEVPDKRRLFSQLRFLLKDKGSFLMVEPQFHVNKKNFDESLRLAGQIGFVFDKSPQISLSRSALLRI